MTLVTVVTQVCAELRESSSYGGLSGQTPNVNSSDAGVCLHSERRGGIATTPPLRRRYSDRAVTSPGGAFQTDTNLANHRHRTRLLRWLPVTFVDDGAD